MSRSLQLTALCLSLAVCLGSAAAQGCPSGWQQHGEQCYWASTYTVDWNSAQQICGAIAPGAQLASVHSLTEDAFVSETLLDVQRAWLGLRLQDGVWSWADGSPDDWHYWFCDQPWSSGDYCVITNYAGTGQWGTYRCDYEHRFVCQVPLASV